MQTALRSGEEAALDALLAELETDLPGEVPAPAVSTAPALPESTIEPVTGGMSQEDMHALEVEVGVAPAPVEAEAPVTKPKKETKPKTSDKPKKEAKPKAEKKPAEAKPESEEKKEAKPKTTRKYYASKAERVTDKLGASLGEYTVLELQDAVLEGDALKAKQDETMKSLKEAGVKVQNRMTFFMEFAAGQSAKLNNVAHMALTLLKKDGKIVTGEKGNFHEALIANPYSVAAAKAMGGNTVLAMKLLKMVNQGEKGEYVANPNSLYLAKLNQMLGLA